jgi:hypothetical protein
MEMMEMEIQSVPLPINTGAGPETVELHIINKTMVVFTTLARMSLAFLVKLPSYSLLSTLYSLLSTLYSLSSIRFSRLTTVPNIPGIYDQTLRSYSDFLLDNENNDPWLEKMRGIGTLTSAVRSFLQPFTALRK